MHHFDRLLGGRDCFSLSAFSTSSTTSVYKYLLHLTLNLRLFLFFFILIAEKIKVSMIGFHQISIDQGRVGWLVDGRTKSDGSNLKFNINIFYSMKRCQIVDHHFWLWQHNSFQPAPHGQKSTYIWHLFV